MSNKKQEYSNHRQIVPLYHYVTITAKVVLLAGSVLYWYRNPDTLLGGLIFLMAITLISVSLHSRTFALKVQDRAIRAEENFRYYVLTGKRLDPNITLRQVIALRFASDEEFVDLVEKAATQNLKPNEIKKLIRNWRGDDYRV